MSVYRPERWEPRGPYRKKALWLRTIITPFHKEETEAGAGVKESEVTRSRTHWKAVVGTLSGQAPKPKQNIWWMGKDGAKK